MPTKSSSKDTAKPAKKAAAKTTAEGKGRGATPILAAAAATAPVTVTHVEHSHVLYARARRELLDRGLPVEQTRITPVPGRQAVNVDVTPRPALNPPRR